MSLEPRRDGELRQRSQAPSGPSGPSTSASVQNGPNPTSSILISSLPALTIDVTSATSLRERSPGNTLCSVRSPSPCEDGRSSHIVVVEIHWRWSGSTFGSSSGFSQSFINADNFILHKEFTLDPPRLFVKHGWKTTKTVFTIWPWQCALNLVTLSLCRWFYIFKFLIMQMDSEGDSWDMIPTAQLHRFPPYLKHRWKTKCPLMVLSGGSVYKSQIAAVIISDCRNA